MYATSRTAWIRLIEARGFAPAALAAGFFYWLLLLVVLEPDNILRGLQAGHAIDWSDEFLRILGASALGAVATPLLLAQIRRFPVVGPRRLSHAAIQLSSAVLVAAGLILLSCILAPAWLSTEHRPFGVALREQLTANWTLLTAWIGLFVGIGHVVRFQSAGLDVPDASVERAASFLTTVTVRGRGRTIRLALADVDWIETQGNYLALHAGHEVHLIRESLARLEPLLDPASFVRIHRRVVVATDRIVEFVSLGAGDADVRLRDGTSLRLSRTYRTRIEALLRNPTMQDARRLRLP